MFRFSCNDQIMKFVRHFIGLYILHKIQYKFEQQFGIQSQQIEPNHKYNYYQIMTNRANDQTWTNNFQITKSQIFIQDKVVPFETLTICQNIISYPTHQIQESKTSQQVFIIQCDSDSCELLVNHNKIGVKRLFCEQMAKLITRTTDQIFILSNLKRIPFQLQYYDGVIRTIGSNRLCQLFNYFTIFMFLFEKLYELIYEEFASQELIQYVTEKAKRFQEGYQRIPIIIAYLPEELPICQLFRSQCTDFVLRIISEDEFSQNLLRRSTLQLNLQNNFGEDQNEDLDESAITSAGMASKCLNVHNPNLIWILNNLVKTAQHNSIKQEDIKNNIFSLNILSLIKKELEHNNLNDTSSFIILLMNAAHYNGQLFWQICYNSQQLIQTVVTEQICQIYQKKQKLETDNEENLHRFLESVSKIKSARDFIANSIEPIIDLCLSKKVLNLMSKVLSKNKVILERIVPKVLRKLEKKINAKEKKSNKVMIVAIAELFKSLMIEKYHLQIELFKNLMILIQGYPNKKNSEMLCGVFSGIQDLVRAKVVEQQEEQSHYYFYKFHCCIESLKRN